LSRGHPKPPCIVEPEIGIGADVEEHAVLLFASAAGEQHMTGVAQLVEYSLAFVPVVATTWPKPLGKMDDLRYLRHTFVNARQRICFVVDDNEDLNSSKCST
jgi:hypothetical protein